MTSGTAVIAFFFRLSQKEDKELLTEGAKRAAKLRESVNLWIPWNNPEAFRGSAARRFGTAVVPHKKMWSLSMKYESTILCFVDRAF